MKDTIEVKEKKDKEVSFNWADPFLISDQLSEEERMISETASSFANKEPVSYTHLTLPTTPYV